MTDYCKQILGKSIRELTIEDLQIYFSEAKEESEILEFKSGKGDFEGIFNKNILRTVSAFLNSSGGVLIWGAPEDKVPEKGKPKVCVGDLVPVNERKEKDQLINRISSSISYMPTGIRVERLEVDNGYVFIIEVQESESKPHQINGQYFVRLDGQSKPAPHYIVDSMFKVVKLPKLEGRIIFSEWGKPNRSSIFLTFSVFIENISLFINETNVAYQLISNVGKFQINGNRFYDSDPERVLHYGKYILKHHRLEISLPESKNLDNIIIILTFGGEKGQSFVSSYEIDSSKFRQKKMFDYSEYVVVKVENQSFKEQQELIGITRQDGFENLINLLRPSRSKPEAWM